MVAHRHVEGIETTVTDQATLGFFNMAPPAVDVKTHYLALIELKSRPTFIIQPVEGRFAAIVVFRVVLAV